MSLRWQIILLICICICILLYIIYKRYYKTKNKHEGFETSSSNVLIGSVKCMGTSKDLYVAGKDTVQITNTVKNVLFEFLFPPSIKIIQIDSPIEIWSLENGSASTRVLSGTVFAYNYPNIIINNNSTTVTWSLTNSPAKITVNTSPTTNVNIIDSASSSANIQSYGLYMNFCEIESNKMKAQCINDAVILQRTADTLGPETDAETATYDIYETYNFNNLQEPVPTTVRAYDTSQELGEFDFGAPVPWDYENRMYDPADVLWGVIHPICSAEIIKSAYNKTLFTSISPLQFDDVKNTFTYVSPVIGAPTTGEGATADERDAAAIVSLKLFDAMANIGVSSFVEMAAESGTSKALVSTSYGRGLAQQAEINLKVNEYRARYFEHLVQNGVTNKKEIKKIVESAGQSLMNQLKNIDSSDFDDAQKAHLDDAYKKGYGSGTTSTRSEFSRLSDGYRAQALLAEDLKNIRATQPSSPSTTVADDASKAASDSADKGRVTAARGVVNAAGPPKPSVLHTSNISAKPIPPLRITRSVPTGITSSMINVTKGGTKLAARFMASKAGSLSIKFARALGGLAGGSTTIMATATGIGSLLGGPAGAAIGASVGLSLSVILGLFVIACCSFVPAILGAYIPEDAVCPPGYINIYDNLIKACGGNQIVWMIISSIPVIGDGIGAFAPYLCSKYDSNNLIQDVILKKPPVFPDYYYDSSLSIYPDFQKTPLSGNEVWFNDQRKYQITTGVAPVWIDFSDSRILDRMAQYYYKMAKRFATNNYDGTYSFDYISKIYGVIASTQTCCDIQCEIRRKTYYENTGVQQSDYILPVDPINKITYHDRRFYFYVLEPYNSNELPSSSLIKMENFFKTTDIYIKTYNNYVFLTRDTRNSNLSGSNAQLEALMTDNINRYIISGCTNQDGTAPNAYEVNEEGQYVGDAIVSVGGRSVRSIGAAINSSSDMKYYPPALSFNNSFLDQLIHTRATVTAVTSSSISFSYTPSLANNFIAAGTYYDSKGQTKTYTADILKITIKDTTISFTGSVTSTSLGVATVSVSSVPVTLVVGNECVLKIQTRSNSSEIPLAPGQCAESFSKINRFNQNINYLTQGASEQVPSYVVTIRSPTQIPWETSNKFNSKYSTKIWNTNIDQTNKVMPENAFTGQVITGTVLGYVGMRVTWGAIPTGAIGAALASHQWTTTYDSEGNVNPPSSLTGIIACLYEYSTKSLGTFVLNGRSITTQHATLGGRTDLDLYYMYIDRGPIIPFSPGYTPYIDTSINKITQMDCINRYAVRYAVKEISKTNSLYASKLLDIITDTKNTQCAYTFEAVDKLTGDLSTQQAVIKYSYTSDNILPTNRFTLIPNNRISIYAIRTNLSEYPARSTRAPASPTNFTYKTTKPNPELDLTIVSNDFKLIPPNLQSIDAKTAPVDSIQYPDTYIESNVNTWPRTADISRSDRKTLSQQYSCASPLVYNHIFTQFNLKHGGNPIIKSIYNTGSRRGVYYPNSVTGSKQADGTVICIYNTSISSKDTYGADNLDTSFITMLLQKGPDPDTKPYDLVSDDYKSFYTYNKIPKYWIDIPPPLDEVETLALGGSCDVSISSCSNMAVIGNLVGQFNTKFEDTKIMKVRKAYTPKVAGAKVCDFEVEMLHNINNTNNTYIRKESIRIPIIANTSTCMWNMNTDTLPAIDSGRSVRNNVGVSWLPDPYVVPPSFLSNVTSVVTNAVTNFLSLDANNVLVKITTDINNRVNDIANSLESAQYLTGLNCQSKQYSTCRSPDIIQKMINRYYVDNFPVNQYGDTQRYITGIRKVGSALNNNCQVEFIETVSSFADYTKSPIFSSDPRAFESQYNPTSYLRQYEFQITANTNCTFDATSIRQNVLDGTLYKLDLGANSLGSLRSANSVLSGGELGNLSFPASPNVRVRCEDTVSIIPAVKMWYESATYYANKSQRNSLRAVTYAFNSAANTCEYSISSMTWGISKITGNALKTQGQIYLRATWDIDRSYSYNTGIINNSPDTVEMFNPATIKATVNGPNRVYTDDNGVTVSLPYIFGIKDTVKLDNERIKKVDWIPSD